jgi:two-component system nitrogen regulation sensor histidine kinase NtrY
MRRLRLALEDRLATLAWLAGLPATLVALAWVWAQAWPSGLRLIVGAALIAVPTMTGLAARRATQRPLQTLANLLAALREGDYSFRARLGQRPGRQGTLDDVHVEVNALAETLLQQRQGATEASVLLEKVMDAIDVAVFGFDGEGRLRLVNRAGAALLGMPWERALGRTREQAGLTEALEGPMPRITELKLPGGLGRWEVRRGGFRQAGLPLDLFVLSNVSRALREEERQAWQRLIRVLGHELNNSLAPIKSIAGSLARLLERRPRPADAEEDLTRGLSVIASRADALDRFMSAYASLARLPAPRPAQIEIGALVRRAVALETRLAARVVDGPETLLPADADQIEQVLINLLRNAADAALESGGGVTIGWAARRGATPHVEVRIEDEGPGLANTGNLFVPFFTTKPGGSGIGLVLSRQIAEAHGGALTLENREDTRGCRALLRLPLGAETAVADSEGASRS